MKRATGNLRAHRSLALAALRAAGAFCHRHRKVALPHRALVWTPAWLQWARRRGGVRASASPRNSVSMVAPTWHFHLHFPATGSVRVASTSGRVHADRSVRRRRVLRRSLRLFSGSGDRATRSRPELTRGAPAQAAVEARYEPPRVQPRLAYGLGTWVSAAMRYAAGDAHIGRLAGAVPRRLGSTGRLGLRVDLRPLALSMSTQIVEGRLPRSIGGRSFRQASFALPLNTRLKPARNAAQISRQIQRIWRARPAEATATHASLRLQALAIKRPVDLVWRSTRSAAATADSLPRSATSPAMSASVARSTPAVAPVPPGRQIDATVVSASVLDPVLANRLADEVIRRIDRRARIERERRGP